MNDLSSTQSAENRFWAKFIARISKKGITNSKVLRWHVLRAEQYIKAFPDKRLAEHSAEDVNGYLQDIGRKGGIGDWQFIQVVDAIQNLFATAKLELAVDWDFWRASAQSLEMDHPTIAREQPITTEPPVSGVRFKEKTNAPSFLDQMRERYPRALERLIAEIRRRRYSIRTEQVYETWLCRFILFCDARDPETLGAAEIMRFLDDLAVRQNVAASTQNQALNALLFFYQQVLERPMERLDDFQRAKRPKRLPVVLDRVEVRQLLAQLEKGQKTQYLMASLLYGTGMRLMECVRLRVQDVDFGKGDVTIFP